LPPAAECGAGNRVITSPDGITCTARTSAADNGWYGVAWAPRIGLFAAVAISGSGNRVMTSPDGITWTTRLGGRQQLVQLPLGARAGPLLRGRRERHRQPRHDQRLRLHLPLQELRPTTPIDGGVWPRGAAEPLEASRQQPRLGSPLGVTPDSDPGRAFRFVCQGESKMKIAIVVGHNAKAQGARRATEDGESEFVWCGRLADLMAQSWPETVRVFRREATPSGYEAEIRAAYAKVDAWGTEVSAELHFNAAISPAASGTETWYVTDAGRAVAKRVSDALVQVLGLPDRGIKRAGKALAPGVDGTRGYASLIAGRAPAVLVELYFGSNASDCRRADAVRPDLARALYEALTDSVAAAPPPIEPRSVEARLATLEARVAALEAT